MRIVLFDIDGTLLRTGGAGLEALRRAFRELHGVADAATGIDFHGLTDPVIVRSIVSRWLDRDPGPGELASIAECYLEHLDRVLQEDATGFQVLPGARELVEELHAGTSFLLGLATGNFERAAFAKLRHAGLDPYFAFGAFGSDSADREELTRLAVDRGRRRAGPDAAVILIGDTIHDVRCARAARAECLAVATGNASEGTLREAGARWTVPDLAHPTVREILELDGGGPIDPGPAGC